MRDLHSPAARTTLVAWMLLAATAPARAAPETLDAAAVQELEIELADVDLVIEAAPGTSITVDGGGELTRSVERKGDRVAIRARGDGPLRIKLPPGKRIDFRSRSGDLRASGEFSRFTAATASGDLHAQLTADEIDLSTLSGDVTLKCTARVLTIQTVSGDIEAVGKSAEVRSRTTSGDFSLSGELPRRLDLRTVSGQISLDGPLASDALLRIHTTSGDVRVRARGPVGYHLEAYARSGEIRAPEAELVRAQGRVEATARGGGSTIEVHTLSGDIEILP